MEVFVQIERLGAVPTVCLTGRFTMAARNASTLKSQQIAPLSISTPAERGLFAIGEQHKKRKRAEAAASLARVPPTKEEAHLLHARYLDQRAATPVSRTGLESTIHMHPQVRNVHQKVFGGFLMRSAYELAWMVAGTSRPRPRPRCCTLHAALYSPVLTTQRTAASFVNKPVQYLSLDALAFHAPVPIGAMLRLSSQVTYTSEPSADEPCIAGVSVLAQVVDLETGEYKRSNTVSRLKSACKLNPTAIPPPSNACICTSACSSTLALTSATRRTAWRPRRTQRPWSGSRASAGSSLAPRCAPCTKHND